MFNSNENESQSLHIPDRQFDFRSLNDIDLHEGIYREEGGVDEVSLEDYNTPDDP